MDTTGEIILTKLHEISVDKWVDKIICGDCIEEMKKIPNNSIDAVITDPPYELNFMSKDWDRSGIAFNVEVWEECLRVLKPGGYLFSAGIGRTHHRMMCAVEDAGFEIRECVYHVFGSGFPKSRNIGKDVDKLQGNEREIIGKASDFSLDGAKRDANKHKDTRKVKIIDDNGGGWDRIIDKGNSEWENWGSNLKPAVEIWVMARKPLSEKTIAENCLKWGTGAINIDASRVGLEGIERHNTARKTNKGNPFEYNAKTAESFSTGEIERYNTKGRFPANLILAADENGQVHEEIRECFPDNTRMATNPSAIKKNSPFRFMGNEKQ